MKTRSHPGSNRCAGPSWLLLILAATAIVAPGAARGGALDPEAIGKAAGTEARQGPDGVVRIGWSRTDVEVSVDGARLDPAAGLGSWAAFTPARGGAITAIHNHFVFDSLGLSRIQEAIQRRQDQQREQRRGDDPGRALLGILGAQRR